MHFNPKKYLVFVFLMLTLYLSGCSDRPILIEEHNDNWNTVAYPDFNFKIDVPSKLTIYYGNENGYKGSDFLRFGAYTTPTQNPLRFQFRIYIKPSSNPTLEEVRVWANEAIDELLEDPVMLANLGFDEVFYRTEIINNQLVGRRRYVKTQLETEVEEIYIARSQDMVILRIAMDESYFDHYYEHYDFDHIVNSFSPLD